MSLPVQYEDNATGKATFMMGYVRHGYYNLNVNVSVGGTIGSKGGGAGHNNMPPYRVVYIWERVQ